MSNRGFQSDIEDMIDEIVREDKKRIELAFEQIKQKTAAKIQEAIKIAMIDNYYNGYEPLVYNRTNQLPKSVAPLILDDSDNSGLQFAFGIKTSPPKGSKAMRHDKLTVKVTQKNGSTKFYSYNVKNYNPEIEKFIFENFMEGIHPNASPEGFTEPLTTRVYAEINYALDGLLRDGIIDKIIQDAFSK